LNILATPFSKATENPVPFLLYEAMANLGVRVESCSLRRLIFGAWDVWHLHWPAENVLGEAKKPRAFAKLVQFWLRLKIAKARNVKIFWTVHNLRPHEVRNPALERIFWRVFLDSIDGMIFMSRSTMEKIHRELPRTSACPTFIIPHGHYRGAYCNRVDRTGARARLGLDAADFVITFFGQIRPYKGVPNLVRCFRQIAEQGTFLIVAGKTVDRDVALEIQNAAASDSNVRLYLEYVDRDRVQYFLRAADLVVLPYTEILNSGSALLALSFDRPILVPAIGAIPELYELAGRDWVRLYDGELTPELLSDAMQWAKQRSPDEFEHAPLDALDWSRLARLTLEAFRSVCDEQRA
jgi:beta-1,4-mannosyltransferase